MFFFVFFPLSSRSLGFGIHSPELLISHLAGLIGMSPVLGVPCCSLATPTVFLQQVREQRWKMLAYHALENPVADAIILLVEFCVLVLLELLGVRDEKLSRNILR